MSADACTSWLERLLPTIDPALRLAECRRTALDAYLVRVTLGGDEERVLVVPARVLHAAVAADPMAERLLLGVLAGHAPRLRAGSPPARRHAA
jgi:hypothetical protein